MRGLRRYISVILSFSLLLASFSPAASVFADSCEGLATDSQACKDAAGDFNTRNDILFYDKYASEAAACPPQGDTGNVPAGGSTAEQFYKFLVGRGLTPKQAAGIIGNVMQESGGGTFNLNTNALNPSSGAYGLVQWYGSRKTKMIEYAASQGKPKDDLGVQMNYVWIELTGDYKKLVLDPIKASSDLKSATLIWLERYEVPCTPGKCGGEMAIRMPFSNKAYTAFSGLTGEQIGDVTSSSGCTGDGATVDPSGYAFPVVLPKTLVSNGYSWPCRTESPYCHHDGSAAFDLSKKPNNITEGTDVVAIYGGEISNINQNYRNTGCQSIQYKADDGYFYWYGHIRTDSSTPKVGQKVSVGQHLAKVGEKICTGNGSYSHLHIDRGYPKGRTAGNVGNRDPAFIPLMNTMYVNLK